MPFTLITGDFFVSTGASKIINLPSSADYFVTTNVTQMPLAPNPGVCVRGEWYGPKFGVGASPVNDGIRWTKTDGTNVIEIDAFSTATASNGFTYVTQVPSVEPQAAAAITAITNANPAVVTHANSYSENDFIRIYNSTGMLQMGGMVFQISTVSGAGYTLLGLPATAGNGFAAAATGGNTRRVSKHLAVDPEFLFITGISQSQFAVVSTSVDPDPYYVVGNKIHFSVPASFGMSEMNQLTGTILAINSVVAGGNIGAYNLVVDIDSSAFSAFAFPASALSPKASLFATLAPAGSQTSRDPNTLAQTGYEFVKTPFHTGQFTPYMFLAGGAQCPAGAAADVINWAAYKFEN